MVERIRAHDELATVGPCGYCMYSNNTDLDLLMDRPLVLIKVFDMYKWTVIIKKYSFYRK